MKKVVGSPKKITEMAKTLFQEERAMKRLDGWFYIKEIQQKYTEAAAELLPMEKSAFLERKVAEEIPLFISENAIFVGTQRDAFARSYALINPSFEVQKFCGYCDTVAVYNDIEPRGAITKERIEEVKAKDIQTLYTQALQETYAKAETDTAEAVYFMEQVTGHVIPDMRIAIQKGLDALICEAKERAEQEKDPKKASNYRAMQHSMEIPLILARRYTFLVEEALKKASGERKEQLLLLASTLQKVPLKGAETLYEAIQSFQLFWMAMCLEQSPNPYAFSVGNMDRIFEPYRVADGLGREETAALLKHLLVFFNVGDRSWAISQNIIISGRDMKGNDLTNETSYALLDAYYDMNMPQPILSVKLHKNTPEKLYAELGRFFFTPGCLTPSLFNDDSVFEVLLKNGFDPEDIPDYSIAGCQEPLIMGKDNGNTTNTWLNLGKILELTLGNGTSMLTGKQIWKADPDFNPETTLRNIRNLFYKNTEAAVKRMTEAGNNASKALSILPVPFLSTLMGGLETGYDMRDTQHQGTKYNGSGCLIHGLSVVADSFVAIDCLLRDRPQDAGRLIEALKTDFIDDRELHEYLKSCPKYGNNSENVDKEAAMIAEKVADIVRSQKNYLGNSFRVDYSTPSTHLTYGYWVAATPDGRHAREMLNYGVDPFYGDSTSGLSMRMLSSFELPYEKMNGGYASHFGINPRYFRTKSYEEKGLEFRDKVVRPLFFNEWNQKLSPFYLYLNITTPETLRKVLADPKRYAPSGVYIMRIHGTFVNFLDLSPDIQEDIIKRLDMPSTVLIS